MFELVFDNMHKPINVGVVIRLACATGCRLYFTGNSVDYRNRKALLSAVGLEERAELIYEKDFFGLIARLKTEGKRIIGTSPTGPKLYTQMDYTQPTVLVFGNEASGMSKEKQAVMDELVNIPMPGRIDSLNVVMSSAIVVYEGLRQRNFE